MKIAVVGLGVMGLSICGALTRAGHQVFGWDQFSNGHEHGSSHGDARIFRLAPGEGQVYRELAVNALSHWLRLQTEQSEQLFVRAPLVVGGPASSKFVAETIAAGLALGVPTKILSAKGIGEITKGRLSLPHDWTVALQLGAGVLKADAALKALAADARSHGATLSWNAAVGTPIIEPKLTIGSEQHLFERVILAPGRWVRSAAPSLAEHFTIVRKSVCYAKWHGAIDHDGARPIICLDDEYGLYGLPTSDGLYKLGHHEEVCVDIEHADRDFSDANPTSQIALHAKRYLIGAIPVRRTTPDCYYTLTRDAKFVITELNECRSILLMSCCSGHGFKYAPALGDLAVDWIVHGTTAGSILPFSLSDKKAFSTTDSGLKQPR